LRRTLSSIGARLVQSAVLQTFVAEAGLDGFLTAVAGGHGDQFMAHQPSHGLPVIQQPLSSGRPGDQLFGTGILRKPKKSLPFWQCRAARESVS
jgi:hypothetical protein